VTKYDRWKTQGRWKHCDICGVDWCEADGCCACESCRKCGAQFHAVCWDCEGNEEEEDDDE
jgi:hypothetical protein